MSSKDGSDGDDEEGGEGGEGVEEGEEGEVVQCCFSPRLCTVIGCCKLHGGQSTGGAGRGRRQEGSGEGSQEQVRVRSRRGSARGVMREGEGRHASVEDMFLSTSFDWMHCDERVTVRDAAADGGGDVEDKAERMRITVWRIADEVRT